MSRSSYQPPRGHRFVPRFEPFDRRPTKYPFPLDWCNHQVRQTLADLLTEDMLSLEEADERPEPGNCGNTAWKYFSSGQCHADRNVHDIAVAIMDAMQDLHTYGCRLIPDDSPLKSMPGNENRQGFRRSVQDLKLDPRVRFQWVRYVLRHSKTLCWWACKGPVLDHETDICLQKIAAGPKGGMSYAQQTVASVSKRRRERKTGACKPDEKSEDEAADSGSESSSDKRRLSEDGAPRREASQLKASRREAALRTLSEKTAAALDAVQAQLNIGPCFPPIVPAYQPILIPTSASVPQWSFPALPSLNVHLSQLGRPAARTLPPPPPKTSERPTTDPHNYAQPGNGACQQHPIIQPVGGQWQPSMPTVTFVGNGAASSHNGPHNAGYEPATDRVWTPMSNMKLWDRVLLSPIGSVESRKRPPAATLQPQPQGLGPNIHLGPQCQDAFLRAHKRLGK